MSTPEHILPQPWHREPWPWILMAGPALVIVAGFVTLWLAIASDDGLVAEDYYKRGLAINQTLHRGQAARELGLSATVAFDEAAGTATVSMTGGANLPAVLSLRLVHPTRAVADQTLPLHRTGAGQYVAALDAPVGGRRVVLIEDAARQWRLTGEAAGGQTGVSLLPQ